MNPKQIASYIKSFANNYRSGMSFSLRKIKAG